jgi:hypothetical protein
MRAERNSLGLPWSGCDFPNVGGGSDRAVQTRDATIATPPGGDEVIDELSVPTNS